MELQTFGSDIANYVGMIFGVVFMLMVVGLMWSPLAGLISRRLAPIHRKDECRGVLKR